MKNLRQSSSTSSSSSASPAAKRRRMNTSPYDVSEQSTPEKVLEIVTSEAETERSSSSEMEFDYEETDSFLSDASEGEESDDEDTLSEYAWDSDTSDSSSLTDWSDSELDHDTKTMRMNHTGSYEFMEKLGEGTFGVVYSAMNKKEKRVALKISKSGFTLGHTMEQTVYNMIASNEHPNLLKFHRADVLKKPRYNWSPNVLITELLGGSIHDIMDAAGLKAQGMFDRESKVVCAFPPADISTIGKQIAVGMLHLEKMGICHLDLKPENLLFTHAPFGLTGRSCLPLIRMRCLNIKIGDYGSCAFHEHLGSESNLSIVQTQNFRAPEVFCGLPFNKKSDVWSFGAVMSELATGEFLFFGDKTQHHEFSESTQLEMMQNIVGESVPDRMWNDAEELDADFRVPRPDKDHEGFDPSPPLTELITNAKLLEFLQYVLRVDYLERPSFEDLLGHSYFNDK